MGDENLQNNKAEVSFERDDNQNVGEIISLMEEVYSHPEVRTNPELLRLAFLHTPHESTRMQWVSKLANIGLSEDEQVYEIWRKLSLDPTITDDEVLTIRCKPGSEPSASFMTVKGYADSNGGMSVGGLIPGKLDKEVINRFRSVVLRKLGRFTEDTTETAAPEQIVDKWNGYTRWYVSKMFNK